MKPDTDPGPGRETSAPQTQKTEKSTGPDRDQAVRPPRPSTQKTKRRAERSKQVKKNAAQHMETEGIKFVRFVFVA